MEIIEIESKIFLVSSRFSVSAKSSVRSTCSIYVCSTSYRSCSRVSMMLGHKKIPTNSYLIIKDNDDERIQQILLDDFFDFK